MLVWYPFPNLLSNIQAVCDFKMTNPVAGQRLKVLLLLQLHTDH